MVEVSFDGKRVYLTNSLYTSLDEQFYPDGIKGWMAKIQVDGPGTDEMSVDTRFLPDLEGMRPHQTQLLRRRCFIGLLLLRIGGEHDFFIDHSSGSGRVSSD